MRIVRELGNSSLDLALSTDWSKDGFSEKDFDEWLVCVFRFLSVMSKHAPSDLIRKV